jgi:hypothetical protein
LLPGEFSPSHGESAAASGDLSKLLDGAIETDELVILFPPRGIGWDAWDGNARKQVQLRRRFMLLGQTLDGMRVWDVRRAIQTIRSAGIAGDLPLRVHAESGMAVNALYASLFEPGISGLVLRGLPASHDSGPDYLNVLRICDLPQALAVALERTPVALIAPAEGSADYALETSRRLEWKHRLAIEK